MERKASNGRKENKKEWQGMEMKAKKEQRQERMKGGTNVFNKLIKKYHSQLYIYIKQRILGKEWKPRNERQAKE